MVLRNVLSVQVILLFLAIIWKTSNAQNGPLCYQCDHVPHQRDCTRIVQCGVHEKCFGKRFVTPDGLNYFSSGCEAVTSCAAKRSLPQQNVEEINGEKRAQTVDFLACDKCCDSDYCNVDQCETSQVQKHRCLYCDDVLHPNQCNLALQCDDDQICYTEEIFVNRERRYRLGCAHNESCSKTSGVTTGIVQAQGIGKRESIRDRYSSQRALPSNPSYCAQCCTGENCNRDLCSGKNVPTAQELVTPPLLLLCQDYDSRECAMRLSRDNNFCTQKAYRYHLCPVTCRSCYGFPPAGLPGGSGGSGGTTAPVPGITLPPIATSTSKPSGCVDLPQCQKYKDFFCDPSHPEGQKVCPVTCGRCGLTTPSSGTTVTPINRNCVDPIPRCRCEKLDRILNLCLDGDEDTKQFCCYYCSEKINKNKVCPNTVCEAAEQVEKEKVMKMNLTIPCDNV